MDAGPSPLYNWAPCFSRKTIHSSTFTSRSTPCLLLLPKFINILESWLMISWLFSHQVSPVSWSCFFTWFNIRKIRPFFSQHATQMLVRAMVISCFDYCTMLLCVWWRCSRWSRMRWCVWSSTNQSKPMSPHWLPVAAMKFRSPMLAYRELAGLEQSGKAHTTSHSPWVPLADQTCPSLLPESSRRLTSRTTFFANSNYLSPPFSSILLLLSILNW